LLVFRQPRDNDRPTVCIVRHSYYPDGHVRRDAEALVQAGYNVTVIALRRPEQASRETLSGVDIHRLPVQRRRGSPLRYAWEYLSFAFLAFLRLTSLHLRRRFAVVEVDNMPDILVFSALVPKLTGTPVILYIFDNMPELLAHVKGLQPRHALVRLLSFLERLCTRFASRVIVTQEFALRTIVDRGVPVDKINVILNCPDESVFHVKPFRQRSQSSNSFTIVTHGSILKRYGIQVLIAALPELQKRVPRLEAHIFGDGEYRPYLVEQAERLGVSEIVRFHGFAPLDVLLDYLDRADVGYAGMLCDLMLSNKLMEYTALGIPAVVARWPTFEFYFPEDTVTYFAPGDAGSLAEALLQVHNDPVAAADRAKRAGLVYQRYRWEVQRERYLQVYAELAGERRQQRVADLTSDISA
jgi:glycosyltransferase involved in cell wall biosynthesis